MQATDHQYVCSPKDQMLGGGLGPGSHGPSSREYRWVGEGQWYVYEDFFSTKVATGRVGIVVYTKE